MVPDDGVISAKRANLRATLAVVVAGLTLYGWTAAPDLTLVDSAELALACATGGVAHPPGFPLYLLVGRVFTALPFDTPVRSLNLMSAFWMALAAGAVFVGCERMLAATSTERNDNGVNASRFGGAALAAATFLTARNPWTWSSVAEVYALNVFLLASGWAAAWIVLGTRDDRTRGRAVVATCVFACLGLANHHATAVLLLPVLVAMVVGGRPLLLRTKRLWFAAIASLAGAAALYLYLFVAAAGDPGLGWGGIASPSLLWRHVTGAQYSQQVGAETAESIQVAIEFAVLLVFGCGLPSALLAIVGLVTGIGRRRGRRTWLVGTTAAFLILLNLALSTNYIAGPEDRMAYDLPATVAWAFLAGAGGAWLLGRVPGRRRLRVATAALAVVVGWNLFENWNDCNLHDERTARTFVTETLEQVPRDALVVTSEWNFYAPFLYMRHLENYRPDLDVVDVLMMRRFWYLDFLARTTAHSLEGSREEFAAFRREVTAFDLGQPYDQGAIQTLYDALLHRWIELGLARGGAFVDWASLDKPQEVSWIRTVPTIPEGLLLRFVPAGEALEPRPIEPKDAANLAYVRSKITERTVRGDHSDLVPRHDPYRKIWDAYQKGVHASLLYTIGRGGEEARRPLAADYVVWYPEMTYALEIVARRGG